MFFTEKRYRSNNIGCINNDNSNTIPLRACSIKVLNSEIRSSVKGHYSAVTVETPTE